MFTIKQKQHREDVPIARLAMLHLNKSKLLRRLLTMDEAWVYHFTLNTKEQSVDWNGRILFKRGDIVLYAGKVMASVFLGPREVVFIDKLKKGNAINGEYYSFLLQRLSDEISEKITIGKYWTGKIVFQ